MEQTCGRERERPEVRAVGREVRCEGEWRVVLYL